MPSPTTSSESMAEHAFRELQLQVLRSLAWLSVAVYVLWFASMDWATDPPPLLVARTVIAAVSVAMLVGVRAEAAWKYGMALLAMFEAASIVRVCVAPEGREVLEAAVYGSRRILPVLSAVFAGVPFTIGAAAWLCVESFVAVALRRAAADPSFASTALADLSRLALSPEDQRIVFHEITYIVIATTFGCTLVRSYRAALGQLGDALQARQRFITNMNHEIRTPLVGVLGMADLVLHSDHLTAKLREQVQVIRNSTTALLAIVNSILDASKLQVNLMPVVPTLANIRDIVDSTMRMHEAVAVSNAVPYRVIVDPALPAIVKVDANHVQRILGNLVDGARSIVARPGAGCDLANAFKFSASGHVGVVVGFARLPSGRASVAGLLKPQPLERAFAEWSFSEAEISHMAVSQSHPATNAIIAVNDRSRLLRTLWPRALEPAPTETLREWLWFKVTDRGVGIRRDALDRVRQRFQQADSSITRRYGGSGLGLSISSELATLLGGELVYASAEGVGSVFVVAVPCEVVSDDAPSPRSSSPDPPDTVSPVTPPSQRPARKRDRPLVLVVDDNPVNVAVLQRQLGMIRCDSEVARNGREAVDHVRGTLVAGGPHGDADGADSAAPDLILMDLHMPVMNGLEAATAIRALEKTLRPSSGPIPIITVSADSQDAMGELARAAGMQAYLRKPFVVNELRALVAEWLPDHVYFKEA